MILFCLTEGIAIKPENYLTINPGGGGGVLNKFLHGEALPRGPTPYPFIYHFSRKGIPFVYLLLTNGTPFTYPVQNFASLSTAVNALSFKQEQITKRERFPDFIKPYAIHLLALLGPFTAQMIDFSTFRILQRVKSLPFHIPEV